MCHFQCFGHILNYTASGQSALYFATATAIVVVVGVGVAAIWNGPNRFAYNNTYCTSLIVFHSKQQWRNRLRGSECERTWIKTTTLLMTQVINISDFKFAHSVYVWVPFAVALICRFAILPFLFILLHFVWQHSHRFFPVRLLCLCAPHTVSDTFDELTHRIITWQNIIYSWIRFCVRSLMLNTALAHTQKQPMYIRYTFDVSQLGEWQTKPDNVNESLKYRKNILKNNKE